MSTLNSGLTPYLTGLQLFAFIDVRIVAQLISDSGYTIGAGPNPNPNVVANHPVTTTLLGAASGELEAAVLKGERYQIADLQLLVGSNSGLFLQQLVAGLVAKALSYRRLEWSTQLKDLVDSTRLQIQALEDGQLVFGILENQAAGLPSHHVDTPRDVWDRNLVETIMFPYYGLRSNLRYFNRNFGGGGTGGP